MVETTSNVYLGIDVSLNPENNDIEFGTKNDFKLKSNNNNLIQAMANRLKTAQGEFVNHPDYGSKLSSIIGRVGNTLILSEIRQVVKAALLQEPRIQENGILSIEPTYRDPFPG